MTDVILQPKNRFTWALLAFQGGYVNVGGLLAVNVFVSHITGFSAYFSTEIFNGNFLKSLYFLLVPLFFLIGSFLSSVLAEMGKMKKREPIYIHILSFLSISYFLISLAGHYDYFSAFGEPYYNFRDFVLISSLAFLCGCQNAIFTHYSKSIIRTTHLTGITTDLGVGLAKQLIAKDANEKYVNKIRVDLIIFFILGSLISVLLFSKYQFKGFLIPSVISLFVGFRLFLTRKMPQE